LIGPREGSTASLTNGAQPITSTGSTAAQIVADLSSMLAVIESPGDTLRWVMRPLTLAYINAKLAGVGYPTERGYLLGIPVVAGSTSPHQIALIDAENIAFSTDESITLDVSTEASIEMDSAPSEIGVSGTGAQQASLYQLGLVAIRADFAAYWQNIHYSTGSPTVPAGAAYCVVSY
jgi:hypothetical protein